MDIFERISKDSGGPIGQYRERADGYFAFPRLEGEMGPRMTFNGREVLCWSLNNYLGLANHPEIRRVDAEAAAKYGLAAPMGARMMTGHTRMHEHFEKELADFEKKEAAYLFNFGYQGIVSTIDTLVNPHDVIVYDNEAHACLLDGIRLHIGNKYKYRHNNMEDLEKKLKDAASLGVLFLEVSPPELLAWRAVIQYQSERGRLSDRLIHEAIKRFPQEEFFHKQALKLALQRRNKDQILSCYDQLIAVSKEPASEHYRKILFLEHQGSKEEAAAVLRELLQGRGPRAMRDMVALNAGLAIFLVEQGATLDECMVKGRAAVEQAAGRGFVHA